MGRFSRLGNELYGGRRSIDFVAPAGTLVPHLGGPRRPAVAIVLIKGLAFGIEFTGGTQYRVPVAASDVTQDERGRRPRGDRRRGHRGDRRRRSSRRPARRSSSRSRSSPRRRATRSRRSSPTRSRSTGEISQDEISASWGKEVGQRAVLGVAVFLVLVMLFIAIYFREWKMSLAAFVALVHDIAITIGVYSLSGFPVTPAAVTGLLAILGFSLYDTVVVFDKVKENTHQLRQNRQTYAHAANLAVNQTLVRSVNTGIVALIPIGAILFTSAALLGASSLKDLALSQFVGMAVGVYSSVFLAPRVLVHLKSNETDVVLAERRAKARARREADKYAVGAVVHRGHAGPRRGRQDLPEDIDDDGTRPSPAPATEPRSRGGGARTGHPDPVAADRQQLGVRAAAAEPAAEVQARQEVLGTRT